MLALIGLRCTGKTTLGRLLAAHFDVPFVDLDEALCALAHSEGRAETSAGALLTALGEPAFRRLEGRALNQALATVVPLVLATGGGVVELEANRRALAARALNVWLTAPSEVLGERLRASGVSRPALGCGDASAELGELESRRRPHYGALADLELDSSIEGVESCVRRLCKPLALDAVRGFVVH